MATLKLSVKLNKDETLTVKVARMVEHIGVSGKTKAQVFDAVKYAAMSKGAFLPDIEITEIIDQEFKNKGVKIAA